LNVSVQPRAATGLSRRTHEHNKTPPHIKLDEKMEVSDGGRLELENPLSKGTRVVLFVVREPPDDF